MQIRLKIAGTDRSSFMLEGEWEIEQQARGQIDRCEFVLHDPTKALSLSGGQEVIIEDFSDSSNRLFGGLLTGLTSLTYGGIGLRYQCEALGWVHELSRAVIRGIFHNQTDQFLITDSTGIFGSASDFDFSAYTVSTANIKLGDANTGRMQLEGETVRDIMDTLADAAGFVWGVEPDQTVYYRPLGEASVAFGLSDNPDESTTYGYRGLQRYQNFVDLVNAVIVYGGKTLDESTTETKPNDGTQTVIHLDNRWLATDDGKDGRLEVATNTGTQGSPNFGTLLDVGLPNEDGTFDVVWDELANVLEFDTAPPAFTNAFQIRGDRLRDLIYEEVDQPSVDANGRWEIAVRDVTLTTDIAAERKAKIELNRRKAERERITLTTTQDGLKVGQLIALTNSNRGITATNYLIEKLVTVGLGGTTLEYEVVLTGITS